MEERAHLYSFFDTKTYKYRTKFILKSVVCPKFESKVQIYTLKIRSYYIHRQLIYRPSNDYMITNHIIQDNKPILLS